MTPTPSLPKTILVPVDFSESGDRALDYAVSLAKVFGASIVALHAYEIPTYGVLDGAYVVPSDIAAKLADASTKALESLVAARRSSFPDLRGELKHDDPCTAILRGIADHGVDLVVMGTHGRKGLSHFLLGSVAERVIRTSPVPVITVRAPSKT